MRALLFWHHGPSQHHMHNCSLTSQLVISVRDALNISQTSRRRTSRLRGANSSATVLEATRSHLLRDVTYARDKSAATRDNVWCTPAALWPLKQQFGKRTVIDHVAGKLSCALCTDVVRLESGNENCM